MAREVRRVALWLSLVSLIEMASAAPWAAAEEPKPLDARSQQFLLTGQEPTEPFVPLNPRTIEDTRRLEAIKQFCIGKRLENDLRWNEAIEAYQKALEHDPQSLDIYKRLIPLCNNARRKQDYAKYLHEANDLAPDDYELLDRLGQEMLDQEQFEAAMTFFQRAIASPELDSHDSRAVLLKYKVGTLFDQLNDSDHASDYYREVLEAMQRPAEYHLDSPQMRPFLQNFVEIYERFGNTFRKAKRYDDALSAYQRAQAISPHSSRFFQPIAEVYRDQKKYEEALQQLEKYLNDQPQGSQPYELLADVLDNLGRGDEILPRVEAAAQKDRFNVGLQYFLGTLYEDAGQIDKAKQIYTAVLKNGADDRVYKSLARIYQKEDRFRELIVLVGSGLEKDLQGRTSLVEALDDRFRAIASDPDAVDKLVETARAMREEDPKLLSLGARLFVARVAQVAKQIDAAIEFYRSCLDERKAAFFYDELSDMLLASNRVQEAISVIQESMEEGGRSNDPKAYCDLARALEVDGQTSDALKAVARAIELDPEGFLGHYTQASVYSHSGQYQKAAEKYEQILEHQEFSNNPMIVRTVRYLVSNVYVQLGEMLKAERALEEILAQNPDDAPANNDLGYLWADYGKNLEQALEMIRKALEAEPDNAAYLDSMGWVLYKLGRAAEARTYLEDAVEREEGSQDGTITDHLGDVYLRLKEFVKARAMWEKAEQIFENAQGPRRDEKRLKEIRDKLKSLEAHKNDPSEIKRDRSNTP